MDAALLQAAEKLLVRQAGVHPDRRCLGDQALHFIQQGQDEFQGALGAVHATLAQAPVQDVTLAAQDGDEGLVDTMAIWPLYSEPGW